jgi:hypothetical protein
MVLRKGQMFVVTAVFLASMLFAVQQIFITYASLDTAEPFESKQAYVMGNIIDSINDTILTAGPGTTGCRQFQKNLDELLSIIKDDVSSEGFILEADYEMDCGNWDNSYPNPPPMKLSIRFVETYNIDGNVIDFYHN